MVDTIACVETWSRKVDPFITTPLRTLHSATRHSIYRKRLVQPMGMSQEARPTLGNPDMVVAKPSPSALTKQPVSDANVAQLERRTGTTQPA